MLKWVFERCEGTAEAVETPIGSLPADGALDLSDLDVPSSDLAELLHLDVSGWLSDLAGVREHYARYGDRVPAELRAEFDALERRLEAHAADRRRCCQVRRKCTSD